MSLVSRATNRLRELYRNVLVRSRAANVETLSYPRQLHAKAVMPLIEQLEPRLMMSVTGFSVTGPGGLAEGAELTMAATIEAEDLDRIEVRTGAGPTEVIPYAGPGQGTFNFTKSISYGDNGKYGASATAIYRDTEAVTLTPNMGKVHHPALGSVDEVVYLLYSVNPLMTGANNRGFNLESGADEHLVFVRYSGDEVQYATVDNGAEGSPWLAFGTPQAGDVLLAKMRLSDGVVTDYLDRIGVEVAGLELGYAEGTLRYRDPSERRLDDPDADTPVVGERVTRFTFTSNTFTRNAAFVSGNRAEETVTITNVAPVIADSTIAMPAPEGDWVYLNVDFTDAGIEDRHTITVDWGDSNVETTEQGPGNWVWTELQQNDESGLWSDTGIGAAQLAHRYPNGITNGIIKVTVTDDDGMGSITRTLAAVTVTDAADAPTATTATLDGTALTVRGTDGADNIVIQKDEGSITVLSGGEEVDYGGGAVSSVAIYGFGGDDNVLVLGESPANTTPVEVYGGAGDDTLVGLSYGGGLTLMGGAGDDVLMDYSSVDGAEAMITGDAGLDRFFVKATTQVMDESTQEKAEEQRFDISGILRR